MVFDLFFLTAGSRGGDLGKFLDLFVMFFQIPTKQFRSKGLISICKLFCRYYQLILQIMMPFLVALHGSQLSPVGEIDFISTGGLDYLVISFVKTLFILNNELGIN